MSADEHPIVREEESLLADVRTRLMERPVTVGPSERDLVIELQRLREELGHAKAEDMGAILEQYDRHFALLHQLRESRERHADPDPDCPYFAHMRLAESGRTRDLFLGKATRIEHGMRIVDWRHAPIARLFYRYQEGEEYEEEMGDRTVLGVLESRRTLSIGLGTLRRIDCPQGVFIRRGDDAWDRSRLSDHRLAGGQGSALLAHDRGTGSRRRLGADLRDDRQRADKHLPDIAALIDPEQFELITQPDSGLVVIRGIAGSGKTTVALHRVAWLAYQDPQRFRADRMIVVVWGRAMRDYISKVLPSLGVNGVEVRTWRRWSERLVRRHFPKLPRGTAEDTPEVVSRLKLHPALLALLEDQMEAIDNPPNARGVFEDFLSLFLHLERLVKVIQEAAPGAFTEDELARVWSWQARQRAALTTWVEGDRSEPAELDPEDLAILLRLWQLRAGPLRHRGKRPLRYSHMVVDEVQDLSPIEVAVLLGTLDDQRSVTLAGDTQQHIIEASGFSDWRRMFGFVGLEGTAVNTLKVSYRSTHEITSFARALLGPYIEDDHPPLTTRPGQPVELFRFTDHGGCVAFLADVLQDLTRHEPLASIALITPTAEVSAMYADGLEQAEVARLRRVIDQEFAFAPGIEIVEINEVKGLEFDYVVLIEAAARYYPDNAHARRLLHVGATRAAHQLWLTSVGTPSPILAGLREA